MGHTSEEETIFVKKNGLQIEPAIWDSFLAIECRYRAVRALKLWGSLKCASNSIVMHVCMQWGVTASDKLDMEHTKGEIPQENAINQKGPSTELRHHSVHRAHTSAVGGEQVADTRASSTTKLRDGCCGEDQNVGPKVAT